MRIHILSDLHLEFGDFTVPEVSPDLAILAGDISIRRKAVQWAHESFNCPVVLVLGNHDYWGEHLTRLPAKMRELAKGTRVTVLERNELVLDGIRILGGTCWTDFALAENVLLAMDLAEENIRDYQRIRTDKDYRRLRPHHVTLENMLFRQWLREQLAQPFDGSTVVVTHHAPSIFSLPESYRQNPLLLANSAAYASNMEGEMQGVSLWVHGHTHFSSDYRVGGTRVVCNPRGYAGVEVNPDFDAGLTIDIGLSEPSHARQADQHPLAGAKRKGAPCSGPLGMAPYGPSS